MEKTVHTGEDIKGGTYVLSEHEFVGCEFDRTQFIYRGEPLSELKMTGCQLNDCRFGFEGAAAETFLFLSSMYNQSPKMDDSIKILIENIFIGIRAGTIFKKKDDHHAEDKHT